MAYAVYVSDRKGYFNVKPTEYVGPLIAAQVGAIQKESFCDYYLAAMGYADNFHFGVVSWCLDYLYHWVIYESEYAITR